MSRPFLFRLGRYKTLLISLTLSVVFGVLVCVSPYPSIFIVMRFCLAAASAGVYLTLYITREYSVQPLLVVDLQTLCEGVLKPNVKCQRASRSVGPHVLIQTVNLRMLNRCLKSFGVLLKMERLQSHTCHAKNPMPSNSLFSIIKQELNYIILTF